MRLAILSASFCCLTAGLGATGVRDLNERGVQAYRKGSYDSSLSSFNEAQKLAPESRIIDFNVGNALHQQGRYEEALLNYKEAYDPRDSAMAAEVFYNMGNTYFRAGHLDSAVAAYKQALIANPEDRDAKFNLELALKKLEQQQQQQCQQDQQDDKKQNQQQDQNKQDQQQGQSQDQKQDQDKKAQQLEQDEQKQD